MPRSVQNPSFKSGMPSTDIRRSRIIFALDATASRKPTWDSACAIQSEMFSVTDSLGGVEIQLVFFRGGHDLYPAECKASKWLPNSASLQQAMQSVSCRTGATQIRRVLQHSITEATDRKVNALIYVGDACEEPINDIGELAGQLGIRGVPAFVFQEGTDQKAKKAFKAIADLTVGAYFTFDQKSADQLRKLLGAVAVFISGGNLALEKYAASEGGAATLLLQQMKK